jgi:hypothetical protein
MCILRLLPIVSTKYAAGIAGGSGSNPPDVCIFPPLHCRCLCEKTEWTKKWRKYAVGLTPMVHNPIAQTKPVINLSVMNCQYLMENNRYLHIPSMCGTFTCNIHSVDIEWHGTQGLIAQARGFSSTHWYIVPTEY